MERLSEATLSRAAGDVERPRHDRRAMLPGIVHLGLGAFHRAHQAVYTEDCLAAGETGWGIVGVSLRRPDMRDALEPQDALYTLATRDGTGERLRVMGALAGIVVAPEAPERLMQAMVDPRVRIVSLTVTEKGYTADMASGRLDTGLPAVMADLAHPDRPATAVGVIVAALMRRRAAGVAPFTVVSCDNLAGNGGLLHRVLADYADRVDPGLGRFVERELACPSTMVDRIVPATTEADRAAIAARLGLRDAWPVVAEGFSEWVVEDRFPQGRPDWGRAGALMVADVAAWERMKLRMLNGAHTLLALVGRVAGLDNVAEAVAHPAVVRLVQAFWAEVAPTLPVGADPAGYARRLLLRFGNPALRHPLAQIARDASQKLPPRLIAPLLDLRRMGRPVPVLTFALAAWMRSCDGGRDESGAEVAVDDPALSLWPGRPGPGLDAEAHVRQMMAHAPVFGDLGQDEALVAAVAWELALIRAGGIVAAARRLTGEV
jgi:fructuronate reductase